jgi:hypothetical protein
MTPQTHTSPSKRLVEDLGNSEDESQSEDIRNEMRESISSALDGHSTRMLTNLYVFSQVCSIRRAVVGRNTVSITTKFITEVFNLTNVQPFHRLKPVLKKNATNDILTTEIQTNIRNNDNNEIIRDKLKSYKKYIDPQKYKTLHKQLNMSSLLPKSSTNLLTSLLLLITN